MYDVPIVEQKAIDKTMGIIVEGLYSQQASQQVNKQFTASSRADNFTSIRLSIETRWWSCGSRY